MKELSIEQKAKAYDDAIKKAGDRYNEEYTSTLERSTLAYVFPELAELEEERMRKAAIEFVRQNNSFNYCLGISKEDVIEWFEKQGEQKPTELEPKFKVGDWIVFNGITLYIKEVVKGYYRTISNDGIHNSYDWYIDDAARLWTIQDAKQGDVLATDNGVCIFDGNLEEGKYPFAYCSITKRDFESYNGYLPFSHDDDIHPATKEQRDLFFQKMKEAGYEWDAEKKELKIVDWSKHIKYESNGPSITKENNAWSEEDDIMAHDIDYALRGQIIYPISKLQSMSNWILNFKNRVQLQPMHEGGSEVKRWSEEDDLKLNQIIEYIMQNKNFSSDGAMYAVNFLQRMKERLEYDISIDSEGINSYRLGFVDGKIGVLNHPKAYGLSDWIPGEIELNAFKDMLNKYHGDYNVTLTVIYEKLVELSKLKDINARG